MSEWKPIGSRIPSHFDAGRIAGLREAAEIIKAKRDREQGFAAHHKQNGSHYKAREAMHGVRLLDGEHRNILARIAELEKP